ncbi:hypothetical protein BJ912DRAFT_683750 [Pholiota molesta]|nr:hypothetical protein BJ912DRAFT_683750 [Pholiota molesta]
MLPTFRRLSLRPELPSNGSSIRRFIHNSLCAYGPSPFHLGATTIETRTGLGISHDDARTLHFDSASLTKEPASSVSGAEISSTSNSTGIESSKGPTTSTKSRKIAKPLRMSDDAVSTRPSKPKKAPRKVVEPPTKKIETFLQRVESEKDILTLVDAERYNTPTIPDTRSPQYEVEYNQVMNNLIRSFSMLNLRKIFDLYKLPHLPMSRQTKVPYVQAILEHWGWTPIAVVRDTVLDETKASELRIPLRVEEAFLLMGKDGAELLSLAKRYAVNLSFSDHPMALKAKGLQGSLKRLEGYLKSFKKDIVSETTSLRQGQSLSSETLKSISRLSGAYLASEKDKFHIFFHKSQPWTSKIAQYLAVQAASGQTADTTQAVYLPDFETSKNAEHSPSTYSLYPFSPHQRLSWKIPSSNSISRLRRVGQWLETIHLQSNSAQRDENFDRSMLFDESNTNLKAQLLGQPSISRVPYSSLVVSACTGHFLFLSPTSQGQALVPPPLSQLDRMDISRWNQEPPERFAFQQSVPTSILVSPADKEQHIRKLVYVEQATRNDHSNSARTLNLEIPQKSNSAQENEACKPTCYLSKEIRVNVLIPDRFTDIQFSAAGVHEILPSQFPAEFLSYIARLESGFVGFIYQYESHDLNQWFRSQEEPQELAPFELEFDGITYTLNSDIYVHREFKEVSLHDMRINILMETHVDAGIGQNSSVCKILCEDYSTEAGWKNFLEQCNRLTIAN